MENEPLFKEVDVTELNGNGRDFVEGFAVGLDVVAAVAGIVALT